LLTAEGDKAIERAAPEKLRDSTTRRKTISSPKRSTASL
jgi:hypothetical protein